MRPNTISLLVMLMRIGALVAKFALTLFLAKFVSLESVAIYGMIAGAVILVPIGLSMGVAQSIVRDAAHQSRNATAKRVRLYLSATAVQYLLLLSVLIGYCVIVQQFVPLLVLVVIYLEQIGNDSSNLLIAVRRPLAANVLIFIRSALWIYLYIASAFYYESLRSIDILLTFWAISCVLVVLIVILLFREWRWPSCRVSKPALLAWFWRRSKLSRYLYVSEVSSNVSFYIDRFVLSSALDLKMAGVYTIYSSIGMALYNLVSSGVMQIARPKMVRAYAESEFGYFKSLYKDCLKRSLTFSVLLSVSSVGIFWLIFPYMDEQLLENYSVFAFVLGCVCIRVLADVKGYKLYTSKHDFAFMKSTIVSVAVSVVCNVLLVPYIGIWGAACSLFFTYIVTYIARSYYLNRLEVRI